MLDAAAAAAVGVIIGDKGDVAFVVIVFDVVIVVDARVRFW